MTIESCKKNLKGDILMNFQGCRKAAEAALSNEVIVIEHGTSTIKVLPVRRGEDVACSDDILCVEPVVGRGGGEKKTYFGAEAVSKCERRKLRYAFKMTNNGWIQVGTTTIVHSTFGANI